MTNTRSSATAAALSGAGLLATLGGVGVAMILRVGLTRRDETHIVMALLMLAVLLAAGAVGGLVYHAASGIRERRRAWPVVGWAVPALTALAVVAMAGRALVAPFARVAPEAHRLELLTAFTALLPLAIAAALLAVQLAVVVGSGRSSSTPTRSVDPGLSRMFGWITFATIVAAGLHVLDEPSRLQLPESAADAEPMLARAETDARLRPDDAHAQLALGLTLLELKRYGEAEPLLRRAAELQPDSTHALNALGWMLNAQQRFTESVEPLRAAVRLDPEYGNAHHNLGWAWINLRRLDDAEAAYAQAVRHLPRSGSAAIEYSWVLHTRGKHDAALRYALRATTLLPDDPRSHVAAGSVLHDMGRFPEAERHLEAVLRLDPNRPAIWAMLGVTRFMMDDMPGADEAFAEAQRLSPSFFDARAEELAMWENARQRVRATPAEGPRSRTRHAGDAGVR